MRITTQMLYQQATRHLSPLRDRIAKAQDAVHGKTLTRPSSDPVKVIQTLDASEAMRRAERTLRTADDVLDWLSAMETAISAMADRLLDAQDVVMTAGGANISDPSSREALALEIEKIRDSLLSLANTRYRNRYIFAGFKTDTKPFSDDPLTGGVTYAGDGGRIQQEVVPGIVVASNMPGDLLLEKGDFFQTLTQLANDLRANSQQEILEERLREIREAYNWLADLRGEIGTRYKQVEVHRQASQDLQILLEERVAEITGVDVETAVLELYTAHNAYQIVLGSIQRVIDMMNAINLFR